MEILYPKNVTKEAITAEMAVEETVKDTTVLTAFVKNLVKVKEMPVEEIIKLVDAEYVKTNSESIHFLADEITAVCKEIDLEFRPIETVDENTLPEAGL
jgi:hypothetical protein